MWAGKQLDVAVMRTRLAFGYIVGAALVAPIGSVLILAGVINLALSALAWPFAWTQRRCAELLQPPGAR